MSSSKRKASDENPLLNPLKRTKHEKDKAKAKRKIPNGEEQPGGLVIVRAPSLSQEPRPPSRQQSLPPPAITHKRTVRAESQPPSASQPQPSSSKARPSQASSSQPILSPIRDIEQHRSSVDNDVRAMDDESDTYRRQSRARNIHPSLLPTQLQGEPPPPESNSSRRAMSVDTTQALPVADSPVIQRNKAMRQGAMDAIREDDTTQTPSGHRRRSSGGGRGNRIRLSIESTGAITQPHNSVSESSFYKHIPEELPEADRMRLLLSWCTTRASNTPLPDELSPKLSAVFQSVEEKVLRQLSDKLVDTRTSTPQDSSTRPTRKNEQNESNRRFEVSYTEQIRSYERESEAWEKTKQHYEHYVRQRTAKLLEPIVPMSAKSKGKQKATLQDNADDWRPVRVASRFQDAWIRTRAVRKPPEDNESIQQGLKDLEFSVDMINEHLSRSRAIATQVEHMLDARFARLRVEANMAPAAAAGSSLLTKSGHAADAQDLLRALVRVDRARPPAKVGDAARRAVREVQRIEEQGIEAVGDRRLTGVPQTPRTPKRGSTPGREKQ